MNSIWPSSIERTLIGQRLPVTWTRPIVPSVTHGPICGSAGWSSEVRHTNGWPARLTPRGRFVMKCGLATPPCLRASE